MKWIVTVLLLLGALSGLSVLKSVFFRSEAIAAPDYSSMQKTSEYFTTLYLNWSGDLEDRKLKMKQIAPVVADYLVKGKQTVNFVSASTPYFSKGRGFVDVVAWTKIKSLNEQNEVVYYPRKYDATIFFAQKEDGSYQIDSVPMMSIDKTIEKLSEKKSSSAEQAVIDMVEPVLTVFIPAFLSGDMSTAQNLILPESEIKPYAGEYVFKKIDDIRVRIPEGASTGEYVVDVTVTVTDKNLDQQLTMLLNLQVEQQSSKFYITRAVS